MNKKELRNQIKEYKRISITVREIKDSDISRFSNGDKTRFVSFTSLAAALEILYNELRDENKNEK